MKCAGCLEKVKWWHRKRKYSVDNFGKIKDKNWHRRCWIAWKQGHLSAWHTAEQENVLAGLPTPSELYKKRSIGIS